MALKLLVTDINTVAEGQRGLYVDQKDGTWLLDLDEKDEKSKVNEFRDNNRKLAKEKEGLVAELEKFKGVDVTKYQEALKLLEQVDKLEESKLLKEGKWDEVVLKRTAAMKSQHEAEKAALLKAKEDTEKLAQGFKSKLESVLIDTTVRDATAKAGAIRSTAMDDILSRGRQVFKLEDDGSIVARDSKGEVIYGKEGKPLSPDEWSQNLITAAPHLFEPSKGGGAKGGRDTGARDARKVIDRDNPEEFGRNIEAIAKGTVVPQ